ncbi:hypothetical protein ACMFMF_008766 [Clarireedia jacksonii]
MADRQLRLLCLDGGGIRGLASLYLLKKIMSYVGDKKPCEFFDMICGTSTGGLIAIMLGRLEMSVDECIEAFTSMMDIVFVRSHRLPFRWTNGKVQASFVVAMSAESATPVHFTNYHKPGESAMYDNITILEAALATSAATTFFEPKKILSGGIYRTFVDAGLGENNPINRLWIEAKTEFGPGALEPQIRCLLSIGTGRPSLSAFGERLRDVGQSIIDIATETERSANNFYETHTELTNRDGYLRFNPPDITEIGLDEARKRNIIEARTEVYVVDHVVRERMFKFRQASGTEENAITRPPPTIVPPKFFYSLSSKPIHIKRDVSSYWRHLTLDSYTIYERIFNNCKPVWRGRIATKASSTTTDIPFLNQFNQFEPSQKTVTSIWERLLRPDNPLPLEQTSLPKDLVMSAIYMLHMETALSKYKYNPPTRADGSEGIDKDRREALKRFAKWVPCQCRYECGNEWNFVNEVGLRRPKDNEKKCGLQRVLGRGTRTYWNILEGKNLDAVERTREIWKSAKR